MRNGYKIFDADMHIMENVKFVEYMDPEYRGRGPKLLSNSLEVIDDYVIARTQIEGPRHDVLSIARREEHPDLGLRGIDQTCELRPGRVGLLQHAAEADRRTRLCFDERAYSADRLPRRRRDIRAVEIDALVDNGKVGTDAERIIRGSPP